MKKIIGMLLALGLVSAASASTIAWEGAQDISGDSDVSTNGTAVFAANFNSLTEANTVNGVNFIGGGGNATMQNSSVYGTDLTYTVNRDNATAYTNAAAPFSALSTEYQALLVSAIFENGESSNVLTLGGLTIGDVYEIQLWISDPRRFGLGKSMTVDGVEVIDFNVDDVAGSPGQYIIGVFNADAATQDFSLVGNSWQLNALQLRAVEQDKAMAIDQDIVDFPDATVSITLSGISSDGAALTYAIVDTPTTGTLDTALIPNVVYTPTTSGYQGVDSFTFTVSDGISTSDPATITVTMTNQVPIAATQNVSTFPDTPVAITLTGTDPDGGPDSNLTYFVEQPIHGDLIGATNMWTYTPMNGYQGEDSFTFTVFDGLGTSDVAAVSITVTNLLPTADAINASTGAGTPVVITLSGSDPEGSNLTYSVESLPGNGSLDDTLLPEVTYTPASGFIGEDRFTYSVNDGLVSSVAATVTVSVASAGGVTIAAVGAGAGYDIIGLEASGFYSTNLVKNFDVGTTIDNKYGTDGYYIFGGAGVKNSADYNTAGAFVASVPSFVDAFFADPGATLVRNNTSQTPVDDPSAVSNGMDFAYGGYLMNNGTAGTEDLPMLQFSVNGSEAVTFRLGVLAGNENDTKFDPSAIRLSFADGTTASVSSLESFLGTDPTNHIGMVFFDVSIGAGTIGTFTLAASENSNNPTIAGVTFDVGFVSPSEINDFGIGVVPGGTKVALSWTAVANATYGVEATDNVVHGPWASMIEGIDGINGVLSVTNDITKGQEFYRAYIAE